MQTRLLPLGLLLFGALSFASTVPTAPQFWVEGAENFSISQLQGAEQQSDGWLNRVELRLLTNGALPYNLFYDASIRIAEERTSFPLNIHHYQPYDGIPYNLHQPERRTWDIFTGKVRYNSSWFTLQTGIDYLPQGPAERNPLIIGGADIPWRPWHHNSSTVLERAPLLHTQFAIRAQNLLYTQTSGSLLHTVGYNKYFHNHRLEYSGRGWSVAVGEQVIYGSTISTVDHENPLDSCERQLMWGYALPFVPYFFAEHYFGDRDNSSIYGDFSLSPFRHAAVQNMEFYGEFLIDDLQSPASFFDESWWGNKWALTVGLRNRHRGGVLPWGWGWEYSRIEPWVGTHHKGGGYEMSHYGWPLGSDLGPNSQEHWFYINLHPQPLGEIKLFHSTVWKGGDRGSHLDDLHSYLYDGEGKRFLDPAARMRWNEMGLEWSRPLTQHARFKALYSQLWGEEKGWRGAVGFEMSLQQLTAK